jgi:hypothetical protein
MELLVPGVLLLIVTVLIVFFVIPQFGPTFTILGSVLLLIGGIYHHHKMFRDEYRLATWADRLKAYAPGIMYSVFGLFILGFIFSLWKGGAVPVPSAPSPDLPSNNTPSPASSATPLSNISETLSNITNTASNAVTDAFNASKEFVANVANTVGNYRPAFLGGPAGPVAPAQPYNQGPRPVLRPANNYGKPRANNGRNVSFFSEF